MHDPCSYDPLDPSVLEDPFPAYARLREACPVHRNDRLGYPVYSVARAADVHTIITDPELWSNEQGPGVGYPARGRVVGDIQQFDPPEHTARRKFVRSEFTPTRVAGLASGTRALAHQLVDAMYERHAAELHDDFALPLPIIAFVDLLGVPREDRDRIKGWADRMVLGLADPHAPGDAGQQVLNYVMEKVTERRRAADAAGMPGEEAVGTVVPAGLLSTYALRQYNGARMPDDQLAAMVLQLMVAGHETTTSLITNLVWRLLEERSRWEAVVANPSLAETAVEESLRYDPPVLGLCRTNKEPVTLGGYELEPNTKVMLLYASANRDPAAFRDPDEFRIDRDLQELAHHYSFGWGTHHCLGARLARQTARIGLEVLVERLPDLRLAGPAERIAPAFLWGRRKLPVAW
jgi:cytochrome P450